MLEGSSSLVKRFIAVALLILMTVLAWSIAFAFVDMRIALYRETAQLKELAVGLRQRSRDLSSLEAHLRKLNEELTSAGSILVAETDRAASARIQQMVRKIIDQSGGQLLTLVDGAAAADSVRLQFRARMAEGALERMIYLIETERPQLMLDELSAVVRGQAATPKSQIDVAATVRSKWAKAMRGG